jgi:tetratricopeptide (TPR) repeat protein
MTIRLRHLPLFAAAVLAGCASSHRVLPENPLAITAPVTDDPKATLALAAITPVPQLSSSAQPTSRAPMAALELFARARDLMVAGKPAQAIGLFQQAIVIDPGRFDLQNELGLAYLSVGQADDSAIAAFEKAAAIDPNHLALQTELGRLYLDKNDTEDALPHLRLALQTDEYSTDDGEAAVADYLLAEALQRLGYDRAALDQYLVVLHRLDNPTNELRDNAELAYLLERPETLYIQVGELLEKHAEYDQAVKAFEPAADREPDNFELHARIARDLAQLGRRDEALQKSVDLIVQDRATPASLAVLRQVCSILNIHKGDMAELRKLARVRPADQAVLFALSDTLVADGQTAEAVQLLESAWQKSHGDMRLARRLFALYRTTDATLAATQMLIGTLARNPEGLHNITPLWSELFQTGWANHLTLQSATEVLVPANQQPAKLLLIGLEAEDEERPAVARETIERAADAQPVFAPAQREWIALIWGQSKLSDEGKIQMCDQRIARIKAAGHAALAEELRGRSLLAQKKPGDAAVAFSNAASLGAQSPDLRLASIESRRKNGHDATYERALWQMTVDFPLFEDAYVTLFSYYADPATASPEDASKVLATWLTNDPGNVVARVSQARLDARMGNAREAEQELLRLFEEDPDNADVYTGLRLYYTEINRLDKLTARLEEAHTARPRDTELVARLVGLYADQHRNTEAVRLLDDTRAAVAGDPDLLYSLASLYSNLGQKQTADDLLEQVLRLDPANPGASNDLGFEWADEGKNLPRAEALIRTAVTAEPDNESFLDSLGWVLYKRGEFDQARKQLDLAVASAALPDPAVLDHLGDTLYRLTKTNDAKQAWQRSLAGIGGQETSREDLRQLRLQLMEKIKQVDAKKPIDVPPSS